MKKILWVVAGILILAIATGASFEGGMAYQRNQANQIRAQFQRSRGLDNSTGNGSANGQTNGQRFAQGGGLTGSLKSMQGDTLELSTPFNVTNVNITANTQIEKGIPGATTDLQPGEQLIVRGQRDASGNLNADQILILGNSSQGSTPTP